MLLYGEDVVAEPRGDVVPRRSRGGVEVDGGLGTMSSGEVEEEKRRSPPPVAVTGPRAARRKKFPC